MATRKLPKAVAGVKALRDRLQELAPPGALEADENADVFCQAVRLNLRTLRKQCQVDQSELAKRLDMTQSAVSKIEGGTGDLGLKTLYRYVEALGHRPELLLLQSYQSASAIEEAQSKLLRSMSESISASMAQLVKTQT